MEIIVQKNKKGTYQKHHSFEWFNSRVGSNKDDQLKRVIKILQAADLDQIEKEKREVIKEALRDLTAQYPASFKITMHIADELSRLEDKNVIRYIFHRYRYDVYPQQKKLDNFPPYLQIEPTSICNFRCVFCYQTDKSFSNKQSGMQGSMSLELFKAIIDQIEGKVDFISLASRGEPLVCKDIDAMLHYCVGKFLGLKINTNASLLNEAHCHAILAGGVNTIVFSADAAEEPLYSQLRVGGKLDKILSNIRLFKEIKEKHYPNSKIITRVSGVKVNDGQDLNSMNQTWGDLVDQLAFVAYNPWENVYESPINAVALPCSDLWRRLFVWYDGQTNPCDTDYKSALSTGNINERALSEIWLSESYTKLREHHLNQERLKVNPCRRCTVI